MQHALKPAAGAAGAGIVAPELLDQLDGVVAVSLQEAMPALHARLGRERLTPLAGDLERTPGRRDHDACAWEPPLVVGRGAGLGGVGKGVKEEYEAVLRPCDCSWSQSPPATANRLRCSGKRSEIGT